MLMRMARLALSIVPMTRVANSSVVSTVVLPVLRSRLAPWIQVVHQPYSDSEDQWVLLPIQWSAEGVDEDVVGGALIRWQAVDRLRRDVGRRDRLLLLLG